MVVVVVVVVQVVVRVPVWQSQSHFPGHQDKGGFPLYCQVDHPMKRFGTACHLQAARNKNNEA